MKNSWYALVALDTSSNNEKERRKKRAGLIILLAYILFPSFCLWLCFSGKKKGTPTQKGRTESLKDIRRYVDDHHLLQMGKKSDITTRLHILPNFGFAGWLGWLPTPVCGESHFFPLHYQIQIRPMMAICGSLHSFAALTCFSANTGYCVGVRIITLHFVCRVGVWQPQKVPSRQSLCNTKE